MLHFKIQIMEKNTEKPIKAEIKDGNLLIDGRLKFKLEGLEQIAREADMTYFADAIDDIFYSYARICALFNYCEDKDEFSLAMPQRESIYFLNILKDSLKKMQP